MSVWHLRHAAGQAEMDGAPALAAWYAHEAALAVEAEHLAAVASDTVMSNIAPSYRPTAVLALAAARETWPGLAAEWDRPPL